MHESDSDELKERSKGAAKWSLATELLAKIISPITQLILARLLAPEAFGMVATVTMVVSFAEMFSDAGFKKYLVQNDFEDRRGLYRSANVAFFTNLGMSVVLWCLLAVFREPVAAFVGNPSLGLPLAVAGFSLPLMAFSSIQTAIFQRKLDFRSLLPVRLVSTVLNFSVTLGLAFLGADYWSLIVGTLIGNAVSAFALTVRSDWKPRLFYSFALLKEMFSFSGWTLLESLSIWLSVWAGTFIVGNILGSSELGLYKTPITFVSGCFGIITNATTPILFSALSRLRSDWGEYLGYFRKFQFTMGLFLIPLSVGIFAFREPLVRLLLGEQWEGASLMFGLYGLVQGPMVLLSYYSSEIYRSLGKPRVSTLVQVAFLVLMTPIMVFAASRGFYAVVLGDAVCRLLLIVINQIVTYIVVGISFVQTLQELKESIIASVAMSAFAFLTYRIALSSWFFIAIDMVCCIVIYFAICMLFPKSRRILLNLAEWIGLKKKAGSL